MKPLTLATTLILLSTLPLAAPAAEIPGILTKQTFTTNPTGLQMGFFNGNSDAEVLADFGKRTMCRSIAVHWKNLEPKKGAYDFGSPQFANLKRAHEFGQTPNIGLGISFEQSAPPFYKNILQNPDTQKAAANFIRALTQHLLATIGPCNIIIDGEVITALPITEQNKNLWAKLYIDLANSARQAAAELGKPGQIKIMTVLNGNPFRNRLLQKSPESNKWISDILAVSDYIGVDTYFYDPDKGVTDPAYTIKILQFWIENYGKNKDLIVQEHGFSTALGLKPNLKTNQAGTKYGGTEQQQAEYFKNLCLALQKANQPDGPLRNRLRAFMIYYYKDPPARNARTDDMFWKQHFGVIRSDGTPKPALNTLRAGFHLLQTDPLLTPVKLASTTDLTAQFPIPLTYTTGTEYETLHCSYPIGNSTAATLTIKTSAPGTLLLCINNTIWLADTQSSKLTRKIDLTPHLQKNQQNTLTLHFTSPKYPFTQLIHSLTLTTSK